VPGEVLKLETGLTQGRKKRGSGGRGTIEKSRSESQRRKLSGIVAVCVLTVPSKMGQIQVARKESEVKKGELGGAFEALKREKKGEKAG